MAIVREAAKIVRSDVDDPGLPRPAKYAKVERTGKEARKDRQEIEAHALRVTALQRKVYRRLARRLLAFPYR